MICWYMRDAGWLTNVIGKNVFQPNPLVFSNVCFLPEYMVV